MRNFNDIVNQTKKMKLLYVEDNEEVRISTVSIFNDMFLEIVTAEDGEAGLELYYDNEVDLIISDINLPKLNGLDMIERIRAIDKDIPILILSAYSETSFFTKAIHLNIDSFLLKPIEITSLVESLDKVLNKIDMLNEFNNNLVILEQYQDLTDSNTSVSKTDADGIITFVNDEYCKLSGYTREELIGARHNLVRHPDNPASMYAEIWHTIHYKKEPWQGIIRNISKDGRTYYVNSMIKPIFDKDDNIIEYIAIKINITSVMNPKKQLYDFVDSSTNPILVFIEIEDFENIEKFYGHAAAQLIYDDFANDLQKNISKELAFEKFFSLGDGIYAFIKELENDDFDAIIEDLKEFQYNINELKMDIDDIDYDVSILISVSSGKHCLEDVKSGMKALRRNKQDFIIANSLARQEQEQASKNLQVLKMIKEAIETDNIVSYFQPIIENETKEIVKYESLVRLIDSEGKVLSPYFFLDTAKKGKYYGPITSIVLENSFDALIKTEKIITINLSALDIEKLSTREKIFELLNEHKELAHKVVFELLEDEDIRDIDVLVKFIFDVKEYGVKIAIDDFGAGYSNYERLLKYQPDILKIDGSLIKNIVTDSYSKSVVKSIVTFAQEQGIELVAEFVENESIYMILKDMGVKYSQGYYFGKPDKLENYEQ